MENRAQRLLLSLSTLTNFVKIQIEGERAYEPATMLKAAARCDVSFWPFSSAPIVRLRVRYRRSCCRTGRVVGEAVDDP